MSDHKEESVKIAPSVVSENLGFRKWLYSWLLDPNIQGNYQKPINNFIALLIVGNVFALVLENVPGIAEPNRHLFHWFDIISILIFTIEYLVRFYLAVAGGVKALKSGGILSSRTDCAKGPIRAPCA